MTVNTDCSITPAPVHGVVVFVAADFRIAYPQFAVTPPTDAQLSLYFNLATLILNNSCASVVSDANARERLLNLLVAHIAALIPLATVAGGGGAGAGLVGGLTQATEGSVSVSAAWLSKVSQSMAWFIQTPYGQLFWQLTSPFRSFRYVPPAQCCGPAGAFAGRRGY